MIPLRKPKLLAYEAVIQQFTRRNQRLDKKYMHDGIYSRVIHCYERLLYLGKLRKNEYLRLALVYAKQGRENQAQRIISRYKQIYEII